MADKEKRIKLGVDVGSLANEMIQINRLIEESYNASIRGQSEYNALLDKSIEKLNKEVEILNDLSKLRVSNFTSDKQNDPVIFNQEDNFSNKQNEKFSDENQINSEIVYKYQDEVIGYFDKVLKDTNNISINTDNILIELKEVSKKIGNGGDGSGVGGGGNGEDNSQNNLFNFGKGAIGKAGIIVGAAMLAKKMGDFVIDQSQTAMMEAEKQTRALNIYKAVSGRDITNLGVVEKDIYTPDGIFYNKETVDSGRRDFSELGLSLEEAYKKQAQYIRKNVNLNFQDLAFEKAFNLSSSSILSLLRSTRNEQNQNISSSQLGVNFLNDIVSVGGDKNAVRAYSEDYLKLLVDINEKQLEATGQVNTTLNSKVASGISGLSEAFKDTRVLEGVISNVYRGLTTANSPQVEALQYHVLQNMNPNANLWDLQKMRNDPFGTLARDENGNPIKGSEGQYLVDMVKYLYSIGSNQNGEGYMNVANVLGLKASDVTQEFIDGIVNGEYNVNLAKIEYENLKDNSSNKTFNIENEVERVVANFEKVNAKLTDKYAELGQPILEGMTNLKGAVVNVVDEMGSLSSITNSLGRSFSNLADFINNNFTSVNKTREERYMPSNIRHVKNEEMGIDYYTDVNDLPSAYYKQKKDLSKNLKNINDVLTNKSNAVKNEQGNYIDINSKGTPILENK